MEVKFFTPTREYQEKKSEFDSAVLGFMERGVSMLGKEVTDFEESVKEFTGAKYAIGVASGTDALVMASDILGFKEGTEVITSPFTFLASASCIAKNGSKPVFVDIDEETFGIDASKIEEKITKDTVGILPIHLFSQMSDMDKIMDIASKHNLRVLEDSAESFGMRWKGNGKDYRHAGTIGDFGVFSFFPTKTLGAYGDAGMIVTNDEKLANLAKMYRVHGASRKYHYDFIGYNSRLDAIQASILQVKIKYINNAIEKRDHIAKLYMERLQECEFIKIPKIIGNQESVYYAFNILADRRDELQENLKANKIGTSIYYPIPLHLQKCFEYLGYKKGDFPVAESICDRIIALPIYPEITEEEVEFVCQTINEFYKK
ncbi:DegT/DnrJ/EryC1/StrS family aminotransferase [Clostridium estertheticum]|uniref:DegT/DnrJ/EryC1/StrS family aminotransferase n=1 Tax=Clostridium estertheticum TaxID=238834 RepID=UPI001C6E5852|nr:DegT/DnrJ/EryC1/StrS family aminotransferase [Clostridium estertheticum]MBW9173215.1 DegT/DnrJ/EryC1/StrS family aminotransferase [Clostridium estertheticum]WLC73831.1 DegT/DnrJ/EryC1/StrS family aminotransferase [Clostridium estertheticum]